MSGSGSVVTGGGALKPGISTPWDELNAGYGEDDEALARDLAATEEGEWASQFMAGNRVRYLHYSLTTLSHTSHNTLMIDGSSK
jgi:hypothetical protein